MQCSIYLSYGRTVSRDFYVSKFYVHQRHDTFDKITNFRQIRVGRLRYLCDACLQTVEQQIDRIISPMMGKRGYNIHPEISSVCHYAKSNLLKLA